MKKYDVCVIGSGVAGTFGALKAAQSNKNKKILVIELGRAPKKRRRFLEGFLGCFPTGDGKLYVNDVNKVLEHADGRKTRGAERWVNNILSEVNPMKVTKQKKPSAKLKREIESLGFDLDVHDYIQWKPESVHSLSSLLVEKFDECNNLDFSFDNEVLDINKKRGGFSIECEEGEEVFCKKLVICAGRTGWRWVTGIYEKFSLIVDNNIASYGVKIECQASHLKNFNKSHCSMKRKDLEIGHLNWGGTVIPEDHADLVIAAFRSNENRWKTDKVSFSLIGHRKVEAGKGISESDRLGKLALLLYNDRIGREKVKLITKGTSTLNQLPEYNWLADSINELKTIFPQMVDKASFHSPELLALAPQIRLDSTLQTEVKGLYVAGESAGMKGIMAAAISGVVAVDSACR